MFSSHHLNHQGHVTVAKATDRNSNNNNRMIRQIDDHHQITVNLHPYLRPHLLLWGTEVMGTHLGVQLCFVIDSSCRVQKLRSQVCS